MTDDLERFQDMGCSGTTETSELEFKSSFDPSDAGEWCELIKDIVAIANTTGGIIVFGVDNDGLDVPSFGDPLAAIDPATVTDKIFKYTGIQFGDFRMVDVKRPSGKARPALLIHPTLYPMAFTAAGSYHAIAPNRQKMAFAQGTLYVRHGAKSEAASSGDIRDAFDRLLQRVRHEWLDGIRKVVETPPGLKVLVTSKPEADGRAAAESARLTNDPEAPPLSPVALANYCPHREKDVVSRVLTALGPVHFTTHTVLCVRRIHAVDERAEFAYKPPYGSRLYSQSFVDWLIAQYQKNRDFFDYATAAYSDVRREKSKTTGESATATLK